MGFAEQGEHCRDRCRIASLTADLAAAKAEVERLKEVEQLADDLVCNLLAGRNNTITGFAWDAVRALLALKEVPDAQR